MKRRVIQTTIIASLALAGVAVLLAANFFTPNNQPYGYIAAPASSSPNLSSGNETLYAPWFENGTYSGDLRALPVAADGTPDFLNPSWRAQQRLALQNFDTGRFMVTTTRDASNVLSVIPFRWPSLSTGQKNAIDLANAGNATSPVLDYIRGDRSNELASGGALRNRTSVLGDIIHSTPRYVGAPRAGYTFDSYPTFAVANAARAPRVYVGANDGALHAFDAATGDEVFAFVPGEVVDNLKLLTSTPYWHRYFVDGSLTDGDVYYDAAWRSVLVGGLGAGGQGYFALDITSSAAITSEDNTTGGAGSRVLWEFTDSDDANLGYTYGRPSIVRLQSSGQWVAIVSNGYVNSANSAADGYQGDGVARLYALDIKTGAKLGEIAVTGAADSPLNPNGLSSPTVIDADNDFKGDTVYAGDLKGNVWRFDISGAPATWSSANAERLFTATDSGGAAQAITTAPDVTFHPSGGFLVYISTGRLLDSDDIDPLFPQANSIYALWDEPAGTFPISSSALLTQTLTELSHSNGTKVRVASNNPKDGSGNPIPVDWTTYKGWKVDLPLVGERALTDARLRDKRLQFTTTNPMVVTGETWFLQLDYLTGGAPSATVIDISGDGNLTVSDNVDGNLDGDLLDPEDRVIGQYQSFGLASAPLFASLSVTKDTALINHLNAIDPSVIPEVIPPIVPPGPPGPPLPGPAVPPADDVGLLGGHFDLDTSTSIYGWDNGTTNNHVHQWDDRTGQTTVDYFNIVECPGYDKNFPPPPCLADPSLYQSDPAFDEITDVITAPSQQFIIVVANAPLSTGGVLEINGASMGVVSYDGLVADHVAGTKSLPVYQMGASPPAGVQQLTSLKMSFDARAILQGGLIGTNTGCVRDNNAGPNGEYRNGALLVQAIAVGGNIDATNFYALDNLLWEATIFWHWEGSCYNEPTWQAEWNDCIVNGNVQNCLKPPDGDGSTPPPPPPACPIEPLTTATDANGCTVDTRNPTTLNWAMDFNTDLCASGTAGEATEFRLEFDRDLRDESFTLTFRYNGGSTETVTFDGTTMFSAPTGSELQIDMTGFEFDDEKIKDILLRNKSGSALTINSVDIDWTGGPSDQKLIEVKKKNPDPENTYTSGLPKKGPLNMPLNLTLPGGGANCAYTVTLDYTDASGTAMQSTHTFDNMLTGINGTPLEIDLDESFDRSAKDNIRCLRVRNTTDNALTINTATVSYAGAPSGQTLRRVADETDPTSVATLFSGSSFSPTGITGLNIGVGGVIAGTARNCPATLPDGGSGGSSGGGSGGSGSSGSSGGSSGSGGSGSGGGSTGGAVVPLDPGFNITNTTGSGDNQTGRLMWREIVR